MMEHEEFKKYGLEGSEIEEWFNKFTDAVGITAHEKYSMSKLVNLLSTEVPTRLTDASNRIYATYSEGGDWIDSITMGKTEPRIPNEQKQEFCKYLLDKVLATDSRVLISCADGSSRNILIDVTGNSKKKQEKINKIRGLPHSSDRNGENRNANIPKVRKALGIDKHLVLVLNNDRRLLPSYEKLLSELQDFANGKSRTGCLDLRDVPEHERFIEAPKTDAMAEVFRQLQEKAADLPLAQQLTSIAKSSFLEGFEQTEVKAILTHHPYFQKYLDTGQQRKGEQLAQDFVAKVYEGYLASHHTEVVETIKHCVRKELPDANGAKTHEGKRLILTQAGNTCTVIAKDGRGLIFRQTDSQPTFSRMKQADINAFTKYHESLQELDNPQQRVITISGVQRRGQKKAYPSGQSKSTRIEIHHESR